MDKIVFFEVEKWEEDYIKNSFSGYNPVFSPEKLTKENAANFADSNIVSTFIYSTVDKEVLESLPNLKMISTRSMGYDHIDTAFCKEKGITVSYVPSYGSYTVAEHAFALILAISRKIIPSVEQAKKGDFSSANLQGFDLHGKTLGVIGAGHIGTNVVKLGRAFGMKVLIFSRHKDEELAKDPDIQFVDLDTVLSSSDIVTLHVPHTPETEHMINMSNIEKFKKGAILINTARGALVETQAIVEGLDRGILQAAGLDVLEEENDLKEERELLSSEYLSKVDLKTTLLNHVLLTRDSVVLTPHNAFNSKEAVEEILETTIANIKEFSAGTPQNTV